MGHRASYVVIEQGVTIDILFALGRQEYSDHSAGWPHTHSRLYALIDTG